MIEVKFIKIETGSSLADVQDENKILLFYFINDYHAPYKLPRVIDDLKQVASGEKTFDDIQDPDGDWSFGNDSGTFECDKDTAYFRSERPDTEPSMEMPLQELIDILERWKDFLGIK